MTNRITDAVHDDDSEAVLLALRASIAELLDARMAAAKTSNAIREVPALVARLLDCEARLRELRKAQEVEQDSEARIAAARNSVTDLLAAAQLHAV